jgi:hypothetical protein
MEGDVRMLKSTTAVTYELDDIQCGISELADETLLDIKTGKNSFGEIRPTSIRNRANNAAHNESLVLLAL